MIGVELRLVQYRFSVFVVVAQERSFNVMVFRRATEDVTCSWSSLKLLELNAVGLRMLFCCFGDLNAMLQYHVIGNFLCIVCALCKHEFSHLETQKVWHRDCVFRLALVI